MLLLRTQQSHPRNLWDNSKKRLDLSEGLGNGRYPRHYPPTLPTHTQEGEYVKVQDNGEIPKSGNGTARGELSTLQANPEPPILHLGALRSEEGIQLLKIFG